MLDVDKSETAGLIMIIASVLMTIFTVIVV